MTGWLSMLAYQVSRCRMQIVQLQQKIGTSDDKVQRLEISEQRLKDRVRQLEKSLEVIAPLSRQRGL